MDGRVGVTDGERGSMFLWGLTGVTFQLHPVPQPASVRTSKLSPPVHKQDTLTQAHCGTHSRLGLELEKRIPERFLKVELLKAWMAASALKLHEPLSCYAYHQVEWRQCFHWSTKGETLKTHVSRNGYMNHYTLGCCRGFLCCTVLFSRWPLD